VVSVPLLIETYERATELRERGLSAGALAVLRWLAWRENRETGQCDPRHQDIADGTGLSVGGVRKALAELHDAGLVTWRGQVREKGRGRTSNSYRILDGDLTPPRDDRSDDLTPPRSNRSDLTPPGDDRSGDLTPPGDRAPATTGQSGPSSSGEQELEEV
jgi:hypothetical protein